MSLVFKEQKAPRSSWSVASVLQRGQEHRELKPGKEVGFYSGCNYPPLENINRQVTWSDISFQMILLTILWRMDCRVQDGRDKFEVVQVKDGGGLDQSGLDGGGEKWTMQGLQWRDRAMALLMPWKVAGRGNVSNRALIRSRGQLAKAKLLEASPSGMSRSLSSG